LGLLLLDTRTKLSGSHTPFIGPVLGQWAVIISPVANSISAKKRLYRLISFPDIRGGY
jgi:hypothetical protein